MIWGLCGWGMVVSQQHRLIGISPNLAAILLALNSAALYFAVSASGAIGAVAIGWIDPHLLPFVSTLLIAASAVSAEVAHRLIAAKRRTAIPLVTSRAFGTQS
jgi:predicted MFS family arabinose efflux permease